MKPRIDPRSEFAVCTSHVGVDHKECVPWLEMGWVTGSLMDMKHSLPSIMVVIQKGVSFSFSPALNERKV